MEPRSGLPSFWSTTIAKVLVGDQPCLLQPWLNGRFKFEEKQKGDMASWKADHSAMLQVHVAEMRGAGYHVDVERFFRVTGKYAVISGKVDAILRMDGKRPVIVDFKSGKPRDSDVGQVLLEMVMIPLAWEAPDMQFAGQVIYKNDPPVQLMAKQALDLKPKLFALLKQLGTMERPTPSPSRDACRYCSVPDEECGQRFQDSDDVNTDLF